MADMDLNTMDSKGLAALARRIAEAAKAKAKAEKAVVNLPKNVTTTLDYEGEVPLITLTFPLFSAPSIPNGYGKLLVASSANGNRKYIAVAALKGGVHDGKIVEVEWSARIPE
jgi:hypothetical protein